MTCLEFDDGLVVMIGSILGEDVDAGTEEQCVLVTHGAK